MFQWLKQELCKHGDMKIIEEPTWIGSWSWDNATQHMRRYMLCLKCGYKRKISDK